MSRTDRPGGDVATKSVERLAAEFDDEPDLTWLNTAHQGRLPRSAATAVWTAVEWKLHPHHLHSPQLFTSVPARLRELLATILGAQPEEITLSNSASYGLHVVANGLPLGSGDEVVVAANDFPSDILPWINLRDRGVTTRMVQASTGVPSSEEIATALTPRTRVVCLSWVHSFSGQVLDLDAIGRLCRDRGVWFVLNASQAIGVRPLAVPDVPIDALITVGWKWLCGPYGTGALWLSPALRDALRPAKLYWLSSLTTDELAAPLLDIEQIDPSTTGRLDIFATANFFNYVPFISSLELISRVGIEPIANKVNLLVKRLLDGVDEARYELISDPGNPSSLVLLAPRAEPVTQVIERLSTNGIHVAARAGRVRVSPHLYNTPGEIDRLLELL